MLAHLGQVIFLLGLLLTSCENAPDAQSTYDDVVAAAEVWNKCHLVLPGAPAEAKLRAVGVAAISRS
jgi:hypothetical protein